MRELKQVQWLRGAVANVVLKEDQENAINGKQKDSVREENYAVSSTTVMNVQNQHQSPFHPLNHQEREVEVSVARVHLGSLLDSRAKITCKVFAPTHIVIIDILPNVKSFTLDRVVNSLTSARLRTGRLKINPAKNRRRMVTKVQWLF